ncbi:hypothetical protein Cs7R123_11240 [Catellatospora sp. TT07R-123]|nr:hypothetical protein Cs7R123_11240 [Catellatospora sp. TT07R-123]
MLYDGMFGGVACAGLAEAATTATTAAATATAALRVRTTGAPDCLPSRPVRVAGRGRGGMTDRRSRISRTPARSCYEVGMNVV